MLTLSEIASRIDELHAQLELAHPPMIMTPPQAARVLDVSLETLWRWRKDGSGPPYCQHNRNTVRYLRDDVIQWLEENRNA